MKKIIWLALFALAPAFAQVPAKPAAASATKSAPAVVLRTFATPEDAVKAFVDALRAIDMKSLVAIIGPGSEAWLRSGDPVQDEQDRKRFLGAYDEKNALEKKGADSYILAIGADAWPFAVPIVSRSGQWAFDAKAGQEEVANRRVGRNELDTIQTLHALVAAQQAYAASDAGGPTHAYARRLLSSPGKKDGLYWPAAAGEAASPLEALAEVASAQGYKTTASPGAPQPYRGYYYRMIAADAKDAPGGGFAVVAYPAKYAVSGVMTFLVNQDGAILEKNLGKSTAAVAGAMARYKPDETWRKAQP